MADSIVQGLLRRCAECWEDGAGTDIGAAKLEALTALGFLDKRRAGRHGNVYTFTAAGHAELEAAERAVPKGVEAEHLKWLAREYLADAYANRGGLAQTARSVRRGEHDDTSAIAALMAALAQQRCADPECCNDAPQEDQP